jgi:hypothetical protein
MNRSVARALSFASLLAASCGGPEGPVSPTEVGTPQTAVLVTPDLVDVVSVPTLPGAQVYSYTPDGLLKFQFQLQNKTDQSFFLRIEANFLDESGITVAKRGPLRVAFTPYQIQSIPVTCDNPKGRTVRVQVSPAR